MIRIKSGVELDNLTRHAFYAAFIADTVYEWNGVGECWITSGRDGKHREGSLHYSGRAIDIRSKNVPRDKLEDVLRDMARMLKNYDVILEYPNLANEHFHIEYDPR